MSLDQLGVEADDEVLKAFSLAIALVGMGLEDALREEPAEGEVLIHLATKMISAFLEKNFNTTEMSADLMADSLMSELLKGMDLWEEFR
ncbi:hypothetical protein RGQ21_67680 [Kitasatospora aureofaciens]|nr:hypothetical protein RGQ21_67680 [Kitasatospora aureofaciens]